MGCLVGSHLDSQVLERVPQAWSGTLLGRLEELVRKAGDEGLELAHGAQHLLGFGRVLRGVVDALVGGAEAVRGGRGEEQV